MLWFPYSSFQQVRQPSIPSPVEEDTSKIRDTIGTVFIQGPFILLLVWRSIMFNGSFLRVCRILWFVKKLDFSFLSLGGPSHGVRVWCLGRVPKHRNSQLVHILSFRSYAVVSLFIFPTGMTALDSNRYDSPRFRAPWKKIRQKYGTQP